MGIELGPEHPLQADLRDIQAACRSGGDLAKNLLGFARAGRYTPGRLSVRRVADQVVSLLSHSIPKGIDVRLDGPADLPAVDGDASQLQHMLLNLAINSVQAMGSSGTLTIALAQLEAGATEAPGLKPGRYVQLKMRDTGVGMSPAVLRRAFDPFFTTKPHGAGSGLGLSMVYGTVKHHGGEVRLESEEGNGTIVTVYLPAAEGAAELPAPAPAAPVDRRIVLLVDDEPCLRSACRRLLRSLGHEVIEAENGAVAVEQYRKHRGEIGLVILDLMMPVMDGEQTFRKLRENGAEVPILLCSGLSKEPVAERLIASGARGFLQKPYTLEALREAVRCALLPPDG